MKRAVVCISLLMAMCMLLCACGQTAEQVADVVVNNAIENETENEILDAGIIAPTINGDEHDKVENLVENEPPFVIPEKGTYSEGIVLVKYDGEFTESVLGDLDFIATEPLYAGSSWQVITLGKSADTVDAVEYLTELGCFEKVDYDYIMGVTADVSSVDVSSNPNADGQTNLDAHNVQEGWDYLAEQGKNPGGSPDVIVAVIDTGVDYNHLDLRNNIWVNSAEIPDNGIDDDGNGYVDDIYGWDCVGDDNDPMDDNGHGTHVAGIVAAENNDIGGVGIAFNCKIMALKAGNSSGYFNNSDIAEAIQYAYMNGADVINMSFGGSNISFAVEEALENAYNTSILVAAAGNDGACNNLACKECDKVGVSYPAALPYVIGVMSVDKDGKHSSTFSNYDHNPYDSIEYEVYAVGEGVGSTWPSNKYACLNGTSMAAPTVAGIAALLRSYYSDREVYSTKFIQSQIVNTGTVNPHMSLMGDGHVTDEAHSVADVVKALTKLPKPAVNLYDYYIDDSVSINSANNGNGVIDAGETVRLYISLHNRGGVASNVTVSIDTDRGMGMTDPYFTFVNPTMQLSDIGTYSVRESGDKYFEIVVDEDCPNDYLVDFNIRFTYTNGMDDKDKTVYEDDGKQKAQFNVSKGYLLPALITEDTVYTADRLYIVGQDVVIPEGVTVTFEEGCEIQFYDDREYFNSPTITCYGVLNFNGTPDNVIKIAPNSNHATFNCSINTQSSGATNFTNVIATNLNVKGGNVFNSHLKVQVEKGALYGDEYSAGSVGTGRINISVNKLVNSFVESLTHNTTMVNNIYANEMIGNYIYIYSNNGGRIQCSTLFSDNIILVDKLEKKSYVAQGMFLSGTITNNMFLSAIDSSESLCKIKFNASGTNCNYFNDTYRAYASQVIENYYNSTGTPTIDIYGSLADASLLWPHVVSVEMFDASGNLITTVGREEIKVRVTFNRAMDATQDTFLTFGTIEPYADYRINGTWVSDTVWEGSYSLKAQIENGQNFLKVNNACAADDPTKVVFGEYQLHEFTIDTTAAMSMNLQAIAKENGIELAFAQDDYDTLLGYNIYRATSKDGNYVKLNPAILLPTDNTFLDENAEPGKTYWYTYTVVLTDFSESNPAGKVMATAMDTLAPNMYHTPVNQGYMNNNLVISCTASDNVAISTVTLYYRTVGATEWKTLNMAKQSDKYSAKIFGNELTLDGIEYYIVASDGRNTINKGSAEVPYTVVVKDASAISRIGDVDGDGVVTTKDALMLMQCINGDLILTDDEFKRADLNGDNVLNSSEALRILQYINGNISTLDM